ncbi:MAG: GH92 family glycosyl hydrolase [Flavobacteriales bacterium]
MKNILLVCCLAFFGSAFAQEKDWLNYVNPLMGTDSKYEMSNGNTYPAVGLPWGMNMWTPQTNVMGNGWAYQYDADKIRGFKQTHQPSPWMNDYGQFSLMPGRGKMVFDQELRSSWFSHKSEIAKPDYYSVYLADSDITAELTPTERAACLRFTFPETDSAFIVIDAMDRGSYVKVIPEENKIIGYTTRYSRGELTNFKNYFVIYFDKKIEEFKNWDGEKLVSGLNEIQADHAGLVVGFKTSRGENIQLKVASSFISFEQAELNLKTEIGQHNFDEVHQNARSIWNNTLGKIEVTGGSDEQLQTFYSCLYRTLFFPNKLYELDENQQPIHWSPYNGEVLPGYMFGGTGFWDTFRALYPFLNLVYPEINKEMQQGLVNDYLEGGWLPEWSSPGYADIMIGNNSASVVADAYIKGLRGYDIEKLYEALVHGANNEGPISAVGRLGVNYYNKFGYVPYDVGINENAARTLEYAYDDFAIYQLAKALKRPQSEIDLYANRCLNYKKLFDPSTNFMRGKNADGNFQSPFSPYKWGDAFTEGNSWHYSWSVFHDVKGLIDLMGGSHNFVAKLDSVFSLPPDFDCSYYGEVIHEIREMQVANMGQYAHGNQPIQHMIYLYNYAGEPWKAQYWVREVINRMYHPTPDGYCGDEDNGQTSAWYVFSALGFYPVCPATDQYVIGAPLFPEVKIHLDNGKDILITSENNSSTNRYINSCSLNGKIWDMNWLNHSELMQGAIIHYKMAAEPNLSRGIMRIAAPYSFSEEK